MCTWLLNSTLLKNTLSKLRKTHQWISFASRPTFLTLFTFEVHQNGDCQKTGHVTEIDLLSKNIQPYE